MHTIGWISPNGLTQAIAKFLHMTLENHLTKRRNLLRISRSFDERWAMIWPVMNERKVMQLCPQKVSGSSGFLVPMGSWSWLNAIPPKALFRAFADFPNGIRNNRIGLILFSIKDLYYGIDSFQKIDERVLSVLGIVHFIRAKLGHFSRYHICALALHMKTVHGIYKDLDARAPIQYVINSNSPKNKTCEKRKEKDGPSSLGYISFYLNK